MNTKKLLISFLVIGTLAAFTGCVKVQPWQKGNLAKNIMAFDPDPTESRFVGHVYESKEGSSGGYGVGGGGCGCN